MQNHVAISYKERFDNHWKLTSHLSATSTSPLNKENCIQTNKFETFENSKFFRRKTKVTLNDRNMTSWNCKK